jgi:hypothetical protein
METRDRVDRQEQFDFGRLSLLDSKLNENALSPQEASAVARFLVVNFKVFKQTASGLPIKFEVRVLGPSQVAEMQQRQQNSLT